MHEIGQTAALGLTKDGVPSTLAVIGRFVIPAAIIVEKNYMFALVPYDIRNALKIAIMLRDHERAGRIRDHHPRGVYEAALVVNASGILGRAHGDIRRITAIGIAGPISAADIDREVRIVESAPVTVPTSCREKVS